MFLLGMALKGNFLAYLTDFIFLVVRLLPGNMVMVANDICGKSLKTGSGNGITWKHILAFIFLFLYLFGPPSVSWKGPMKYGLSTFPSVLLSFHLFGCLLGIESLVFSKFWYDAKNPYEVVCDRAGFSRKNFFAPKIGKMNQKWVKNRGFFNILKIFGINFYWICSVKKIYIICCVPA